MQTLQTEKKITFKYKKKNGTFIIHSFLVGTFCFNLISNWGHVPIWWVSS